MLQKIISAYKGGSDFQTALVAKDYFHSDNLEVAKKTVLRAVSYTTKGKDGRSRKQVKQEAIAGTRIASNFFFRFVTQQNQFLLGNGVTLEDTAMKERLGTGFDTMLQMAGEKALVQGVCWGYWNVDHLEVIEAAKDTLSGFVALMDERTGEARLGVQFWQLSPERPQYVRLFERDGVTLYRISKDRPTIVEEKRHYRMRVATDAAGSEIVGGEDYATLPIVPLYANRERRSELTTALKAKIDAYDRIMSDYGDNLERANDVYWVLNNFGGTMDDVAEMLEQIRRLKVVSNISDGVGGGSTAEPHAFEVPYAARQTALEILRKEMYGDAMALDMNEVAGSSLTNVAINAAFSNLNLKCDRFEWMVFHFVQGVLRLIGIETENINFTRRNVVNNSEIVADIAAMRSDIDQQTALELNPYIDQDKIDRIIKNVAAEEASGLAGIDELEDAVKEETSVED